MHKQHLFIPLLALRLLAGAHPTHAQATPASLHFVQNQGQITDQYGHPRKDLDYRLKVNSGFSVFIGNGLIQYQWCRGKAQPEAALPQSYQLQRMDVQLLGANKKATVAAEEKVQYYEQYHLGAVRTIANAYQKITYRDIYPNIDWVIYLKNNIAEYDFVLHPGAKAGDIRIRYRGALSLQQNPDGSVTARTAGGQVTEHAPTALQADGQKIASRFVLNGQTLSFRTAPYKGTLTIDPVLQWATYIGGSLNEFAYQCTTDRSGNVYVAGSTASTANIAGTGAYQTTYGGGTGSATYVGDAYLAKFDASGARLWTTYYGGTGADQGWSVATDTSNNVYLAGFTNSTTGISTAGAQQATLTGSNDAFLVKFDSTGARIWGTYFGGTGNENTMAGVHCDRQGHVYLTGVTTSATGIATTGAHQTITGGSTDAFLAQYNTAGALQWATYYGGSGAESNYIQAASDAQGNVYLCGLTASATGIATASAHQPAYGGNTDGFIAKFSAAGVRSWGSYYGGTDYDRVHALVCGDSGAVYLMGATTSSNGIATAGSFQAAYNGSSSLFLARMDTTGQRIWATYYNGNTTTAAGRQSLATGPAGQLYFTGYTSATTGIATTGAFKDTLTGGTDAVLVKFSPTGVRLWATYYGGGLDENARATATDGLGHIYLCGETASGTNIASTGAYQSVYGGGFMDGFLVQFRDCEMIGSPTTINGVTAVCRGGTYTYSTPLIAGAQTYSWSLPGGWTGSSTSNTITVTAGSDTGSIRVRGVSPCISGPEFTLPIGFAVTATLSPTGRHAVCAGDSVQLHAGPGADHYQWLRDGIALTGATDSVLSAGIAGHYTVVASTGACTDTAGTDTLIVYPLPVPAISFNGSLLTTGNYIAYQWLLDGLALTGAIQRTFQPLVDGSYTVVVTDTNGCTGRSAGYPVSNLGIGPVAPSAFRLYPNPVTDLVYADGSRPLILQLLSPDGRTVLQSARPGAPLQVKELANGLYFVRVLDPEGTLLGVTRIVKGSK